MIEKIRRSENYQYTKKVVNKYTIAMVRDFLVADRNEFRGAFDGVDRRDYNYDDFAGADTTPIKTKVDLSDKLSILQNQGLVKETAYFCTAYSNSMGSDVQQRELSKGFFHGRKLGDYMVDEGTLDPNAGAYTIDAVNANREVGNITSFAQISSLESFKKALSNGRPIVIGSNKIDWRKTEANDSIVIPGSGYGHLFLAVGYYDEEKLIKCVNSYGKNRFDDGYFYIKYEDFDKILFNGKYALFFDRKNHNVLEKYINYFTQQKSDGISRIISYTNLSTSERRSDKKIIFLALRTVWKMNITEEMKI